MYLEHLHERIGYRLEELRQGKGPQKKYLVPGARELVLALRARGLALYLAKRDGRGIRGAPARHHVLFRRRRVRARDDHESFAKVRLIQRILTAPGVRGGEFLGFVDGYVEIENMKEVGGVAVGVATAEPEYQVVDEWKRQRLAGVDADFIVPNFLCHE
jgi:phosphoglycolate phosphatase